MLSPQLTLKINLHERLALLFRNLLLRILGLYQLLISPLMGGTCRFYPSCSDYAKQAIQQHGIVKGGYLSARRLIKCHPFHPGGHDPVPGVNNTDSEKN